MLGHTKGWLGQSVGHRELPRRLESFCSAIVHGVAFSLSKPWLFSPLARFLEENDLRNLRAVQNFLSLRLNVGAQITHGGQV